MWDFGLGLDVLDGVRPFFHASMPAYAADYYGYPGTDYRQVTRASMLELEKTPGVVAERLAGKLYRIFDLSDEKFLTIFADATEERTTSE